MSPPHTSSSSSEPGNPPSEPRTTSESRMAAIPLAPIGPHAFPPPSAIARSTRPLLPPIHPRSSFPPDVARHSSIPSSPGPLGYTGSRAEAYPRNFQQPYNAQWQPMPPMERQPRSQQLIMRDLPPPPGSSHLPPSGGTSSYWDQRTSAETTYEVTPKPTSAGREFRLSADQEANYSFSPLTERPGRQESGSSYPGSTTSSSPYGSALSYPSQPQLTAGLQPSPYEM